MESYVDVKGDIKRLYKELNEVDDLKRELNWIRERAFRCNRLDALERSILGGIDNQLRFMEWAITKSIKKLQAKIAE